MPLLESDIVHCVQSISFRIGQSRDVKVYRSVTVYLQPLCSHVVCLYWSLCHGSFIVYRAFRIGQSRDVNVYRSVTVYLQPLCSHVVCLYWSLYHASFIVYRAFRIGQSRNVEVYRLVTEGTVEEMIYLRQVYKQVGEVGVHVCYCYMYMHAV